MQEESKEKKISVAIVNTHDIRGGAARAAYRLYKGLKSINIDSKMIVREKKLNEKDIIKIRKKRSNYDKVEEEMINSIQLNYINKNRSDISNTLFSFTYPGYDISKVDVLRNSDIINLHWVSFFLSIDSIKKIIDLGKPIVWTLHDQLAFTGGCHYSSGCFQYKEDCKECPQLRESQYDIPFYNLKKKIEIFKKENITVVCPSKWLADLAKESKLFKNFRIEIIPNSVETDIFKPIEQKTVKQKYNLSEDVITILFVAELISEKRKGFQELLEAFIICEKNSYIKKLIEEKKLKLICIGNVGKNFRKIKIPIINLGYKKDNKELVNAYNAADIFVLPSLEDNLPNTMLESMACSTPVISFNIGGMKDVIIDGKNGKIVTAYNTEEFAEAIIELVKNNDLRKSMSLRCREYALNNFQLKHQANRYIKLFNEVIKTKNVINEVKESKNISCNFISPFNIVMDYKINYFYKDFINDYIKRKNEIIKQQEEMIKQQKESIKQQEAQIERIKNCLTYKTGNFVLYPIKKLFEKKKNK
ncbi:MAG: glycosyltransferase [Spirochaetes bacterium]|nr:glycosyltransferase [Spirochaetota bacterium]